MGLNVAHSTFGQSFGIQLMIICVQILMLLCYLNKWFGAQLIARTLSHTRTRLHFIRGFATSTRYYCYILLCDLAHSVLHLFFSCIYIYIYEDDDRICVFLWHFILYIHSSSLFYYIILLKCSIFLFLSFIQSLL